MNASGRTVQSHSSPAQAHARTSRGMSRQCVVIMDSSFGTIQRVGHAAKCLERLRKWETSIQKTCESCVVLSTNMLSSSLAVSMQSAMQCHGGSFNVAHHDCANREALYNVSLAVRACLQYHRHVTGKEANAYNRARCAWSRSCR
jgi:hypothetical protein